jgi:hypothetical protein
MPNKPYIIKLNKFFLKLSGKYKIPLRIQKNFIPEDFRRNNYLLAHYLADIAYYKQIENKTFSSFQWAALNILNSNEDALHLLLKGKLNGVRNFEVEEIYNIAKDFLLKIQD